LAQANYKATKFLEMVTMEGGFATAKDAGIACSRPFVDDALRKIIKAHVFSHLSLGGGSGRGLLGV